MNVVRDAADDQGLASVLARDATKEGPEVRLNLGQDQIAPIFRREHAMYEIGNVSVRHGFSVERWWTRKKGKSSALANLFPDWDCGSGVPIRRARDARLLRAGSTGRGRIFRACSRQ